MIADDTQSATAPFEGPEKLLEVWFAPSPTHIQGAHAAPDGKFGLRNVPLHVWEDMLDIVKCKILSAVHGIEMDAYLLSESSLFIAPHRLILKTCGTTLNLLGLPRILDIAYEHAGFTSVYRCFYSRKSFMFPERQLGPHREWRDEVCFLDAIFNNGSAYTVGKVNGDHWLLYMTSPPAGQSGGSSLVPSPVMSPHMLPALRATPDTKKIALATTQDYTIEILMTHLAPEARSLFYAPPSDDPNVAYTHGQSLSSAIGIADLFPRHLTMLDAHSFSPCGYSSNALLRWGNALTCSDADDDSDYEMSGGEGYYTIHVTPEEGWSYASFECNVPLATTPSLGLGRPGEIPDLRTLIRRVVSIFQPGTITLTLFISSGDGADVDDDAEGNTAVEVAQRAFKAALTQPFNVSSVAGGHGTSGEYGTKATSRSVYRRTDKINYEFGGYDLAFASFELC